MSTISKLADGEYWMTFIWDGEPRRRRVVVQTDTDGVQRTHWANEQWEAYPPAGAADIGLRVDQLPETTRFEARSIELEADESSQVAIDRVADTEGKSLRAGTYELYQRGVLAPTLVNVEEDPGSGDLVAVFCNSGGQRVRVDGLQANPDFTWVRI